MSGHSKWAQIKRTKGVLDQKRGLLFSKLSKKISIAVKEGGGSNDPNVNYKLKAAIDYAKDQGMPNDNIERAIKNTANAGEIKEAIYEGYGPFGTAFLVETATDNSNRTYNNIRKIFSDHGGNIGSQGSVSWQFQTKGQILVERDREDLSEIELEAIDAGADDVRESKEGLEVYTPPNDLDKIKKALAAAGAKIARSDIIKESSQGTDLAEDQKPKVDALFAALENDEDVIAVHTSANL